MLAGGTTVVVERIDRPAAGASAGASGGNRRLQCATTRVTRDVIERDGVRRTGRRADPDGNRLHSDRAVTRHEL